MFSLTDNRRVTKQCHTCGNNPRANRHSKVHCCHPAEKINICLKALHLENILTIRVCITFRWRDFPHNSYLARTTHSLQRLQVWILLVNNLGQFTQRVTCLIVSISASHSRNFPENSYRFLSTHSLRRVQVWLRLVNNYEHFT
jgi:hypothetical protein